MSGKSISSPGARPRTRLRHAVAFIIAAAGAAALFAVTVRAQQAQQNVNVLPIVLPTDPSSQSSIDSAAWRGDLYLQRQVEPTIAISTRNPDHILAFFNDYRAVDIQGDIGIGEQAAGAMTTAWRFVKTFFARLIGRPATSSKPVRVDADEEEADLPATAAASEAWVGGSRSYDGGHTWTGMFIPGAPFDTSTASMNSPLKGFQASTDPVLAAGPCGKFYVALLGFTRNGPSMMAVAEYEDTNNVEGGDTIKYIGTKVLETGNNAQNGYFLDKPAIAVDIKRPSSGCAHNVYVSYTTFNGLTKDGKTQSKVTVARSTDSGATFSTTKINQPYQQGQGTSLAVDPANGNVYIAFRHFNSPDTIVVHKSTNFGQTWSGQPVDILAGNATTPTLQKFDQPTISSSLGDPTALAFRSLAFPTMAVANGAVFVAFTERVDTDPASTGFRKPKVDGSPRIVMMRSTNGGSAWTSVPDPASAGFTTALANQRWAVDMADRDCVPGSDPNCTAPPSPAGFGYLPQSRSSGPQVMPQLSFAGGRLMLLYYESRGWAQWYAGSTSTEFIDSSVGLLQPTPTSATFITGLPRLMDVRAALLSASTGSLMGSSQVSRYQLKPWLKKDANNQLLPETLADVLPVNAPCTPDDAGATTPCIRAVNRVDSPTSASGTSPFIGDYIGVAGVQLVPKPDQSGWMWATSPDMLPSRLFHGIFADNRNLIPPADPDNLASWQNYSPPWKSASCVNAGERNTDVLTSRIDADLVISAPTSYKQLTSIQRAFPIVVTNGTTSNRYFRLSFASGGSLSSFAQQAYDYSTTPPSLVDVNISHLDVLIFPFSSVTRVAYVKPPAAGQTPPLVQVAVTEIQGPLDPNTGQGGDPITGGLTGTITLNWDGSNPALALTNTETHAPSIGAPSIGAPSIGAPSIGAPSIGAPSIGAPSIGASTIGGDTVYDYVDTIWTVENTGNTSTAYLSYAHVDNPEQYEGIYKFQLMVIKSSTNGTLAGCQSGNVSQDEILANVALTTADLKNPSIGAPSIGAPSIGAPSIGAVSFASVPPSDSGGTSDGTLKAPKPKETIKIVLRAYRIVPYASTGTSSTTSGSMALAADATTTGDVIFDPSIDTPSAAVASQSKDVVNGTLIDTIPSDVVGADLTATASNPTASPSTVQAGASVSLPVGGWSLNNIGNFEAASVDGTIENSVYMSAAGGNSPAVRIDTPATWIVSSSIPAGGSVSLPAASVTIPANTAPGTYQLFVLADDGSQSVNGQVSELNETNNVSAGVTITVTTPNTAPVAANDSYSTDEDTTLSQSAPGVLANDTDADNNSLTAALVSGPSHGSLTLNANGSFSYTPSANYNGPDEFTYRASDGTALSNTATVSLTVNAVNDPPTAVADAVTVLEDSGSTTINVLANDSDVDGDSLTISAVSAPTRGTAQIVAGGVAYTPNANANGADSFTYTASDGHGGTATATVAVTITPVNDPPVAVNDSYSTSEDTPLSVPAPGVLSNDSDVDGDTLTAQVVTGPASGTLTLNANGSFTYTPAVNVFGTFGFTYVASDGKGGTSTASVTLTVNGVNDPPVAGNDSYTVQENAVLTVASPGVLANDTDVDSPALTAALVSGPAHGTAALNADGSFTYTPAANYAGADSFTYRASDGSVTSSLATVSITVSGGLADYGFNGLLSPWTLTPIYTANLGNSVPLSWQYLGPNGRPADTSALQPEMRFSKTANADCTGDESAPVINRDTPGNTYFMYTNTKQSPQTWQFNWKTSDPSFTTGCWMVRIYLSGTGQINPPTTQVPTGGFKIILK